MKSASRLDEFDRRAGELVSQLSCDFEDIGIGKTEVLGKHLLLRVVAERGGRDGLPVAEHRTTHVTVREVLERVLSYPPEEDGRLLDVSPEKAGANEHANRGGEHDEARSVRGEGSGRQPKENHNQKEDPARGACPTSDATQETVSSVHPDHLDETFAVQMETALLLRRNLPVVVLGGWVHLREVVGYDGEEAFDLPSRGPASHSL